VIFDDIYYVQRFINYALFYLGLFYLGTMAKGIFAVSKK